MNAHSLRERRHLPGLIECKSSFGSLCIYGAQLPGFFFSPQRRRMGLETTGLEPPRYVFPTNFFTLTNVYLRYYIDNNDDKRHSDDDAIHE